MKTTRKTWKELEKADWTGSNGNLWSQPYVPPRRDKDYIYILRSCEDNKEHAQKSDHCTANQLVSITTSFLSLRLFFDPLKD